MFALDPCPAPCLLTPRCLFPKLAMSGRSYGSAVRRNRLRRQLRELVKVRESAMVPGVYVFGASPRAASYSFEDLGKHVDRLLAKCLEGQPI